MLRHQSYAVSTLGAIAAILPLTLLWFVSLPLGIWALVLLHRPEVQQRYADVAASRWSEEMQGRGRVKWTVLAALLFASLLGGALVAFLFLDREAPAPPPVVQDAVTLEVVDHATGTTIEAPPK